MHLQHFIFGIVRPLRINHVPSQLQSLHIKFLEYFAITKTVMVIQIPTVLSSNYEINSEKSYCNVTAM